MMREDEEYNIITLLYKRFIRRLRQKRIQTVLCFSLTAVIIAFFCTNALSLGYNAYMDTKYIGAVKTRADIENEIASVNACLPCPIDKPLNLYPKIVFNNAFTEKSQIDDNLKLASGQMHRGFAFCLGGENLFALDSPTEAQQLADLYKSSCGEEKSTPSVTEGIYQNSLFLSYGDALCALEGKFAEYSSSDEESALEVSGTGSGIFVRPIVGAVTSNFGKRWGRMHKGTDFAGNTGDDVKAADGGVVTFAGYESSFGNLIILNHNNGYETYYAHLSSVYVKEGDKVKKGDVIGAVGNTGNSQGPHLHFEIRENGEAKNPLDFLFDA